MSSRLLGAAFVALAMAFALTQVAAVFTESVNWDEFASLRRAEAAAKQGRVDGGGRPGLGVIALVPFVAGCTDTMTTVHRARLVWAGITGLLLAGLFVSLWLVGPARARSGQSVALGVATLALVPVFLRWSVQIRTDQPAIAATIWATVALLVSRQAPWRAVIGGGLLAIGYLFSQKAVYVAGLGGLLALGDLMLRQEFDARRELRRAAWLLAGCVAVLVAFQGGVRLLYDTSPGASIERGMRTFAYYRELFGYRLYWSMLPSLVPQLALGLLLLPAAVITVMRRSDAWRRLALAFAILAAGVFVGVFHAAAFPYFWMTLGLFPACAIAVSWPIIDDMLGRFAAPVAMLVWIGLLWIALPYRVEVLVDTQSIQRQSFEFVERSFSRQARGFHADGGLFCRTDPAPFRPYLHETVSGVFSGPEAERHVDEFLEEFRSRPVAFVIQDFLLDAFPERVRRFVDTHYVSYAASVAIPGWRLSGARDETVELDVIVDGEYQWLGDGPISIDGRLVATGGIPLTRGRHQATLATSSEGLLTLAVPGPPQPTTAPFHAPLPVLEIAGRRTRW